MRRFCNRLYHMQTFVLHNCKFWKMQACPFCRNFIPSTINHHSTTHILLFLVTSLPEARLFHGKPETATPCSIATSLDRVWWGFYAAVQFVEIRHCSEAYIAVPCFHLNGYINCWKLFPLNGQTTPLLHTPCTVQTGLSPSMALSLQWRIWSLDGGLRLSSCNTMPGGVRRLTHWWDTIQCGMWTVACPIFAVTWP